MFSVLATVAIATSALPVSAATGAKDGVVSPMAQKQVSQYVNYYSEESIADEIWYEKGGYCGWIPLVDKGEVEGDFGVYFNSHYRGTVYTCD